MDSSCTVECATDVQEEITIIYSVSNFQPILKDFVFAKNHHNYFVRLFTHSQRTGGLANIIFLNNFPTRQRCIKRFRQEKERKREA